MGSQSVITPESVKLKIASQVGQKELLKARGEEAALLVSTLDQILTTTSPHDKHRAIYLITFQRLCGACCILPTTHVISDGLDIDRCPFAAAGGFAYVRKGPYKGREVAIKILKKTPNDDEDKLSKMEKSFYREAAGWKHLGHPNVLSFLGASVESSTLALLSLWMKNGNINEYIRRNFEVNRLELLLDVAKGVEYLHSVHVVHGDLKGANILISDDNRAILADFGLLNVADSVAYLSDTTTALTGGTPRWMSPELLYPDHFGLSDDKPTIASDVYALGMVILEVEAFRCKMKEPEYLTNHLQVLTGAHPFAEIKGHDRVTILVVLDSEQPARPEMSAKIGITDGLWQLLQKCWAREAAERPQVSVLLEFLTEAAPSWIPYSPVQTPYRNFEEIPTATNWGLLSATMPPGGWVVDPEFEVGAPTVTRQLMAGFFDVLQPKITLETIKIKAASRIGRHELLRVSSEEALSVANALDQILTEPGLPNEQRAQCLAALRELCETFRILPNSFIILDGLEMNNDVPFAGGGFADVFQGLYKDLLVAIKTLNRRAVGEELARLEKPFFKEAIDWKYLEHPNVLPLLGVWRNISISLVSPWMENGNINQYVKRHPHANRLELLVDVAKGVEYLHSVGIIHRDIKGANVLISDEGRALLIDFGLMSVELGSRETPFETVAAGGTTRWMAPELLSPEQFGLSSVKPSRSSNVYSFGMVILEVLTGAVPFPEIKRSNFLVLHVVVKGSKPLRPSNSVEMGISDDLWQLLQECWKLESEGRPELRVVREFLQEATPTWGIGPGLQRPSVSGENARSDEKPTTHGDQTAISISGSHIEANSHVDLGTFETADEIVTRTESLATYPDIISETPGRGRMVTGKKTSIISLPATSFLKRSQLLLQSAMALDWVRGVKDLDGRIDRHQALLDLRPPGDKNRAESLNDLGYYRRKRFDQTGEVKDLDEAIQLHRDCLELRPRGHRYRWIAISNLASDLRRRFQKKKSREDLEQAIELDHECLKLCPGTSIIQRR